VANQAAMDRLLNFLYGKDADVLYVSFGKPEYTDYVELGDNSILRLSVMLNVIFQPAMFLNSRDIISFLVALLLIPLFWVVFIWLYKRYKWETSVRQARFRINLAKWKIATERRNHLYYCFRDDVVFIPSEGTSKPADQIKEYLES
jgi:hypothetical protein